MISDDDRMQEIKNHKICDEQGKIKNLSDPIWSIICDNLNQKQPTEETYIQPKNLQSYVFRNKERIKLEFSASEVTSSTDSKHSQKCNAEKVEKTLILISNNVLYKSIIQELAFYLFSIFHEATLAINLSQIYLNFTTFIFTLIGPVCKSFI